MGEVTIDQQSSGDQATQIGNVQGSVNINQPEAVAAFLEIINAAQDEVRAPLQDVLGKLRTNLNWMRDANDVISSQLERVKINLIRFEDATQHCINRTAHEGEIQLRQGTMRYKITEPPFRTFTDVRESWTHLTYDFKRMHRDLAPLLAADRLDALHTQFQALDETVQAAIQQEQTQGTGSDYLQAREKQVSTQTGDLEDLLNATRSDLNLHIARLLDDMAAMIDQIMGVSGS